MLLSAIDIQQYIFETRGSTSHDPSVNLIVAPAAFLRWSPQYIVFVAQIWSLTVQDPVTLRHPQTPVSNQLSRWRSGRIVSVT